MEQTRQPAVAGAFYPDDREELEKMISVFLKENRAEAPGKLRGMVVPHAGYIYSGPVAAKGYGVLDKQDSFEKIIILGPSHHASFPGIAESGFDFWKTPMGMVKTDSLKDELKDKSGFHTYPAVHKPEHSIEVQFPFLQYILKSGFTAYPLLTGEVHPEAIAEELVPIIDSSTFVVVSSDLSHYHSYEQAVSIDSVANRVVPSLDLSAMRNVEACGKTGILILMHIAKNLGWKGKLLDYRNSGDTAGPKDSVVGYGCYAFYEE